MGNIHTMPIKFVDELRQISRGGNNKRIIHK